MGDAVIVSAARTAMGTAFKGSLVGVDAGDPGTAAAAMCAGAGRPTAVVLDASAT